MRCATAPLEVRPRCGLRAVAQRAVLARLRAHVIARVVGEYAVVPFILLIYYYRRRAHHSALHYRPLVPQCCRLG